MSSARDALVREAALLLMAKQPAGKAVMMVLSGGNRQRPVNALVRLDMPGVLRAFDAATGEPLFEAPADDLSRVLAIRGAA